MCMLTVTLSCKNLNTIFALLTRVIRYNVLKFIALLCYGYVAQSADAWLPRSMKQLQIRGVPRGVKMNKNPSRVSRRGSGGLRTSFASFSGVEPTLFAFIANLFFTSFWQKGFFLTVCFLTPRHNWDFILSLVWALIYSRNLFNETSLMNSLSELRSLLS